MTTRFNVSAMAHVDAPPETIYAIIADYQDGHPRILPRQLRNLQVVEGGIGAGTVITFEAHVLGSVQRFRGTISEPEPGRVLVETYEGSGEVTTFTVDPADGGSRSAVTITTEWTTGGIAGLVQWLLAPPVLRRVYAEELRNLASRAAGEAKTGETG